MKLLFLQVCFIISPGLLCQHNENIFNSYKNNGAYYGPGAYGPVGLGGDYQSVGLGRSVGLGHQNYGDYLWGFTGHLPPPPPPPPPPSFPPTPKGVQNVCIDIPLNDEPIRWIIPPGPDAKKDLPNPCHNRHAWRNSCPHPKASCDKSFVETINIGRVHTSSSSCEICCNIENYKCCIYGSSTDIVNKYLQHMGTLASTQNHYSYQRSSNEYEIHYADEPKYILLSHNCDLDAKCKAADFDIPYDNRRQKQRNGDRRHGVIGPRNRLPQSRLPQVAMRSRRDGTTDTGAGKLIPPINQGPNPDASPDGVTPTGTVVPRWVWCNGSVKRYPC